MPSLPPSVLSDSLGSSWAEHQGRQQSYAPRLLCSPNMLKLKPSGKKFGSSGAKDGSLPTAPLCARAGLQAGACFPSTQGLHQTRQTMGYLASHVAQEKVSGKPTPALRTPLSAPLRRGPQS